MGFNSGFKGLNCKGFYQIICILHNSALLHFKHIQLHNSAFPICSINIPFLMYCTTTRTHLLIPQGLACSRAELSTRTRDNLNGSGTHRTGNHFRAKFNLKYA